MNDEALTSDEVAIWEQRVRRFGLDPARHGRGQRRVVTASSIDELKAMINAPVLAEQRPTIAPTGADARRARNLVLRDAIIDHLAGVAEITDPDTRDEISRRFPEFGIEVINALDRRVTASDPLIVNAQHTAANFGTVTIEPGGYIEISVACTLHAVRLIKTGSTTPVVGADIVITGTPGTPGDPGGSNKKGEDGRPGRPGRCDCCGAIATAAGTIGDPGRDGATGTNGGRGGPGQKGPNVLINIDQLGSTITLLNIGGRGGDGGDGQPGGAGGRGGPGGSEKQCGGELSNGGPGGPGGNGSDGAGGGPAGPGGSGGSSWVLFRTPNGSEVLVTNGQADPGTPGKGGDVGRRGDGGASGGRGAKAGPPGSDGTNPGKSGDTATPGARGFVAVNPPQAP